MNGRLIAIAGAMVSPRSFLSISLFSCAIVTGAALVPLPAPKSPLPLAGLEPNRGQAKPEFLFLTRGVLSAAVTSQSILLSPLGVRQTFVASNPNPEVRFLDPLPGIANFYTGADSRKWVSGVPRYSTARLERVYPGVDADYIAQTDGKLTLKLTLQPGADLASIVFEIPVGTDIQPIPDGTLRVPLGSPRFDPILVYPAPTAFQETPARVIRNVRYERVSPKRFGLRVEGQTVSLPLQVEMPLAEFSLPPITSFRFAYDAAGNTFVAATVPEAAGKGDPFPAVRWEGCGEIIAFPITCSDVAVYKFSKTGDLAFVSYFSGGTQDRATFIGVASDGAVVVTGSTDSIDFPVTAGALQTAYAGPAATPSSSSVLYIEGDFFAANLDPATGALRASTYHGGPNPDRIGATALGSDGSVYFMHEWLGRARAGMPVTPGALQRDCPDRCVNAYAARLSADLSRLLYGTYLPGNPGATAKLHSDGSIYYAGTAGSDFPTTPGAFQRTAASDYDGFVARLDPSGSRLMFATYIGGPKNETILRTALAPDGSLWVHVSSFVQCCVAIEYRLVRLSATGERILTDLAMDVGDIAVDRDGNLILTTQGNYTVSPDAFQAGACPGWYLAYLKLSASGQQLFATYLPANARYDFDGTSSRGLPIVWIEPDRFEVIEGQTTGIFTGCVVDGASFGNSDVTSPGAIVTIFGSGLGPQEGASFKLENGRVPATLGGTRVLVNGEPAAILYASHWQVNAILPYTLEEWTYPKIQVEFNGVRAKELRIRIQRAGISLFHLGARPATNLYLPAPPAAALNEDGTLNSPTNPAKPGSRVVLFGTGGGATIPAGVAGEITPLTVRPLQESPLVQIPGVGTSLSVEYAGAAPGLVAGVIQINVKLPDVFPPIPPELRMPPGVLPLSVLTAAGTFYPGWVTIAVSPN